MTAPTHVIAHPGDRWPLCGVKDPLPVVLVDHVAAHVAGYGMTLCDECAEALRGTVEELLAALDAKRSK